MIHDITSDELLKVRPCNYTDMVRIGPYHIACCLQYDIRRNFCKHIRKISSLEKMRQSVCSEVRFWYRWLCLRYLQATLPEFRFFCEVGFWYCFCGRDFGIVARFAHVKNPQKSSDVYRCWRSWKSLSIFQPITELQKWAKSTNSILPTYSWLLYLFYNF